LRFLSEIITMIHQYKLNGYNIVIDAHCGAIHLVDDLVYDMKVTKPGPSLICC
jgi:hypothetical protein